VKRACRLLLLPCGLALAGGLLTAQSAREPLTGARPGYDIDFIGPPLSDPVMQHAKETYVLYGCAYCHGVTLIPRGEAADLMHSALVGADTDGTTIAALLKAGIPQTAKLSPMPQFSDLSDRQLRDIARYIHYARQQGRFRELVESAVAPGDAAAGRTYFDRRCVACHASDLIGVGSKYDARTLRDRMLRPASLQSPPSMTLDALGDAKTAAARRQHDQLLENYMPADVANLMAFLQTR
jgi:mono/diheme cytochrome c family protein